MKYIRTKDGHIAKVVKYYEEDGIYIIEIDGKPYFSVFEDNICGVADTIEELCDEFVCCIGKNTHWLSPFKDFYNTREQWNFETLYGAIWTDKGLIYVAKMNEKGELELL